MVRHSTIQALWLSALLLGCGGGDPDPRPTDAGTMDDMTLGEDAGIVDMTDPADEGRQPDVDDDVDTLCTRCTDNLDCGGDDDLCITISQDESFCSQACDEQAPCPNGYFCAVVDGDAGIQQCVPNDLTCVDRCSETMCSGNDVCNPLTGVCERPLRLCETGCVLDTLCGDGPEDICLGVPNTPDMERACFTGCNPEAEMPECPADFFCAALDPENDPQRGVCYPFDLTCVDRCASVDCGAGENCDPVTGQCAPAQYGACEPGCTNSAQCGGQDDICLNLGIGDGAHCWQDCSDGDCPSGYDCRNLLGTTIRVCIPLGNDCSACYDNACFPDGVCDPVADTCEDLAQDCSIASDCEDGELCDPVSNTCVGIGRPCNGSTWAIDCDNVVTKCTSQRAGVDGTCEKLCTDDSECDNGSCIDTALGRFCLDDLGGAQTCGSLYATGTNVGRPCGPPGCSGSAPTCIDGGGIDGFCSVSCTSDASCGAGQICGGAVGTSGDYCLPLNCLCAGSLGAGTATDAALGAVLGGLGLDQCDITFEAERYADVAQVRDLVGTSTAITRRVGTPIATAGNLEADAQRLDQAADVAEATAAAAAIAGISLTPMVRSFTYPGSEGPLAQAIAELIVAAGDTPDLASLDAAVSGVPVSVQAAAAPLVSAVALQVSAREALLTTTWGATSGAQELFEGAPYIVLPANAAQAAAALDPAVPADAQRLGEGVMFAADLIASADFVGQIPDVAAALAALGPQTFPTISIPTSAGRVIVAGSGDDVHDIATHGTEIAVLIDLGGDDTYTVPAGANGSVANGVSVLLDLGGADTYGYDIVTDPNDGVLLPSDADGRIAATLPLNQANGPVSASDIARQGAGRLGIGILVDLGPGLDTFDSLRISQGAAVLGLGVVWDDGDANFTAEALAQGAAIGGVGALFAGTGTNNYVAWHAAQGFGALGGAGLAHDRGGDDHWFADPGTTGTVLYLSTADRGVSNRNLAQGAAFGEVGAFAGGLGLLRDRAGNDRYTAGTFAQGYAHGVAVAALLEGAGNDVYEVRGLGQGVGAWRGGAVLRDAAGDDEYNQSTTQRLVSHGVGQTLGWGIFLDLGGADLVRYLPSGGGVGLDGGFGLALFAGGDDTHSSTSDATWGFAQINAVAGEPGFDVQTIGIFLDTGAGADTYLRPTVVGIQDNEVWSPGANPPIYAQGVDN